MKDAVVVVDSARDGDEPEFERSVNLENTDSVFHFSKWVGNGVVEYLGTLPLEDELGDKPPESRYSWGTIGLSGVLGWP